MSLLESSQKILDFLLDWILILIWFFIFVKGGQQHYSYAAPSYAPTYPTYSAPAYHAPAAYAPAPAYHAPAPAYHAPAPAYHAPSYSSGY